MGMMMVGAKFRSRAPTTCATNPTFKERLPMTVEKAIPDSLESHEAAKVADIYVKLLIENQKVTDFPIVDDPELIAKKIALLRMTLIKEFMKHPRNVNPQ
jgi:hypothetical protein